jgi:hypothetical protein
VELTLETEGGAPSLAIQEGRTKASAPPTGEARAVVPKGERPGVQPLQLSQWLDGAALLRVVEGKGFRPERRFSLSADAKSLMVELRVSGAALPSPLFGLVRLRARLKYVCSAPSVVPAAQEVVGHPWHTSGTRTKRYAPGAPCAALSELAPVVRT